jgi:hypothetical protein
MLTKFQIIVGVLSIIFLLITFKLIHKQKLREEYSLLWLFTGAIILIFSIFPYFFLSKLFSQVTGLYYLSAVVLIAFLFLLVIVFHFSIVISQLTERNKDLAQRHALLELEFKELKKKLLPRE